MPYKLLNLNKAGLSADFSWLDRLEKIISHKFKLKKQVSIALVGEREIQKLNKIYRHKNKVTDVLSFEMKNDYVLGEVLICLGRARRQAKDKQQTLRSELQLLTVHGLLHLLGYDHEKSLQEQKRQETTEKKILVDLNK